MAISLSYLPQGPFSPTASADSGDGSLVLNDVLLKHDLEFPYSRHVIQIFGWDTDSVGDGSNVDLVCEVFVLGPAGEISQTGDDGFQLLGTLKSTAGAASGPMTGSHTILLDANTAGGGVAIESVSTGGFTSIRYPTKQLKLVFKKEGGTWANVATAKQAKVNVYVKPVQTFTV